MLRSTRNSHVLCDRLCKWSVIIRYQSTDKLDKQWFLLLSPHIDKDLQGVRMQNMFFLNIGFIAAEFKHVEE